MASGDVNVVTYPFCSLGIFPFCMSHVVGEVTYVELFKDAEGKSRVSDVGD